MLMVARNIHTAHVHVHTQAYIDTHTHTHTLKIHNTLTHYSSSCQLILRFTKYATVTYPEQIKLGTPVSRQHVVNLWIHPHLLST